jgi:hypothetical protein
MAPRVVVPVDTWSVIRQELDRVAPQEAVVLPLVSLVRNAGAPHPCVTTDLEHLDGVVLAQAIPVPPSLQRNTSVHVSALPGADAWLDARVEAAVREAPSLRSAAYLHSHPFATGDTSPSGPDIQGHMKPMLRKKTEEGLRVSLSFIACRARMTAEGWLLRVFACTPGQTVVDLGTTEVVNVSHPWVRLARLPHGRHRGMRGTLRRWRRAAFEARLPVAVDDLMDGWVRVRVNAGGHRTLVALLGHASAQVEHLFWVNGAASPVSWPVHDAPSVVLQRVVQMSQVAA